MGIGTHAHVQTYAGKKPPACAVKRPHVPVLARKHCNARGHDQHKREMLRAMLIICVYDCPRTCEHVYA
jgi:hypothetical protein